MIPLDEHSFEYLGRRELTEADRIEARKMREEFERCFLPPGAKLTPISKIKD